MNKTMMSFRLSDTTRHQLSQIGDNMTEEVEKAVDLLWHLQATDAEVVARYGTIERTKGPIYDWRGFKTGATDAFSFHHHLTSGQYYLCVASLPPSVTDLDAATKIYAHFFRAQVMIDSGADPSYIAYSVRGIAHHMGFE